MKKLIIAILILFMASVANAAQVTLQWDDNSPAPDGYRLFQRIEGSNYDYSSPVWQGSDTTTVIDGLRPATLYYFVVRAYIAQDESGDSNEVDFKPDIPAPQNLRINLEISVYIDVNGTPYILSKNEPKE